MRRVGQRLATQEVRAVTPVVRWYLAVYGALIVGAVMSLWRADVLQQLPRRWVIAALGVAFGLGILLALLSRPGGPESHAESHRRDDT